MKATDIRVERVEVTFDDERLSVPLHLSKGRDRGDHLCRGHCAGAHPRGAATCRAEARSCSPDVWAFPAPELEHEEKDRIMRQLCRGHCRLAGGWTGTKIPIQKGIRLEQAAGRTGGATGRG